jgi:hypothetical protein
MNSKQVEAAIIEVLRDTSVLSVVAAQYWMFVNKHGTHPVLMQVNRLVHPAYLRETSDTTGASIDDLFTVTNFGIEKARVHFTGMPPGMFIVSMAPGKEPMIL